MSSVGSQSPSITSSVVSSTPTSGQPCPSCGVDVDATMQHMAGVLQRRQTLMEEKLDVEKQILKQDKRNFKRRAKAAKLQALNSAKQAEAMQVELKEALDAAQQKQREFEEQMQEARNKKEQEDQLQLKEQQQQHQAKADALQERIRELEALQQKQAEDKEDRDRDLHNALEDSQSRVQALEKQLESKQSALESYEMQLLEMERENNDADNKSESVCVQCTRLEVQVQEAQASLAEAHKIEQRLQERSEKLAEEKKTLAAELAAQVTRAADETDQKIQQLADELAKLKASKLSSDETNAALKKQVEELTSETQQLQRDLQTASQQQQQQQAKSLSAAKSTTSSDAVQEEWKPTKEHKFSIEYEWHGTEHCGIYTGWTLNELPDGPGTLRFEDGDVYDGHWKQGQRHHADEHQCCSVFVTLEDGDIYRGGWFEDKLHGSNCTYIWSDGRVYQGEFSRGLREGQAVMTWPHGATFRGHYVDGKRTGEGVYQYSDGRCYTGMYQDDRPHGYGTLVAADGETVIYQGQWEIGEFIGK